MSAGLDLARLARLCEMFRSDSEQERATAARMATSLLQAAGMTWTDLVREAERRGHQDPQWEPAPPPQRAAPSARRSKTWGELTAAPTISRLVALRRHLSAWDRAFVEILEGQADLGLTERQWVVIEAMVEKLKARRLWGSDGR